MTTFHDRVRARAQGEMRELAREELACRIARGEVSAAELDPERFADEILEDMLPWLTPILGETLASLMLQVRVIEQLDARLLERCHA